MFRACLLAALLAVAAFAASPAIAGFETGDFPIDDYPSAFPGIDRIQAKWLQGSLFDTPAFVFNEGDADHICQSLDGKLALATFVTDQTPLQMAFNFQSKMVSVVRAQAYLGSARHWDYVLRWNPFTEEFSILSPDDPDVEADWFADWDRVAACPPIPEPVFFQMGALMGLSGLGLLRLRRKA